MLLLSRKRYVLASPTVIAYLSSAMKSLFYLLLLICLPLGAQNKPEWDDENYLVKDSTLMYVKHHLGLGMYFNDQSRGAEFSYGLALGYKFITLGGIFKVQRHDIMQCQYAALAGGRLRIGNCFLYVSAGPGIQVERYTYEIYYAPQNKYLATETEADLYKGVLTHLEFVRHRKVSGEGIGAFFTFFASNDILVSSFGVNFMFGTRQY